MEVRPRSARSNKKKIYTWIGLIFLGIILYSTNPNESQFKEFLNQDFKSQVKHDGSIKQIFAGTTARLAGMTTVRKDYVIFSTYDISVLGDKYTYIGIFNNFSRIK